MNICLCGTEAGYPHDACCPYPLYRGSSNQVVAWEMAWAKNKQAAQQPLAVDVANAFCNCVAPHFDLVESCSECGKPPRH